MLGGGGGAGFRGLQNYTTLKHRHITTFFASVLEVYRITLLSNACSALLTGYTVLEIYRITLLSNEMYGSLPQFLVLEVYRITLLSNQ